MACPISQQAWRQVFRLGIFHNKLMRASNFPDIFRVAATCTYSGDWRKALSASLYYCAGR